jgi:phospholipase C
MVVISPWSKGGWVNSELFDHTSLIRFIERRFGTQYPGLKENNITAWRRAVIGDLTSAFNFTSPNDRKVPLPSTVTYIPPDNTRHPDYVPVPPVNQALPVQEPGVRPARAVPYELHVRAHADFAEGVLTIHFGNTGKLAAVYQVYSGDGQTGLGPIRSGRTPRFSILGVFPQAVKPDTISQFSAQTVSSAYSKEAE